MSLGRVATRDHGPAPRGTGTHPEKRGLLAPQADIRAGEQQLTRAPDPGFLRSAMALTALSIMTKGLRPVVAACLPGVTSRVVVVRSNPATPFLPPAAGGTSGVGIGAPQAPSDRPPEHPRQP